jgi:hypothetical protein
VAVRASQVVLVVNGTAVTGRQLVPFRASDPAAQEMTPEMFAFLRQRAIDRELVFAEARRQGVELSAAQLAQVEEARRAAAAEGDDPAQLDFDETDLRARLLQTALLDRAGAPLAFAGQDDVDRYYREHGDEFEPLPEESAARAEARARIDLQIRELLANQASARYRQEARAYLDHLQAVAQVSVPADPLR